MKTKIKSINILFDIANLDNSTRTQNRYESLNLHLQNLKFAIHTHVHLSNCTITLHHGRRRRRGRRHRRCRRSIPAIWSDLNVRNLNVRIWIISDMYWKLQLKCPNQKQNTWNMMMNHSCVPLFGQSNVIFWWNDTNNNEIRVLLSYAFRRMKIWCYTLRSRFHQ